MIVSLWVLRIPETAEDIQTMDTEVTDIATKGIILIIETILTTMETGAEVVRDTTLCISLPEDFTTRAIPVSGNSENGPIQL